MLAVVLERIGSVVRFPASASYASIVRRVEMTVCTTLVSTRSQTKWVPYINTFDVALRRRERVLADPIQGLIDLNRTTQTCASSRRAYMVFLLDALGLFSCARQCFVRNGEIDE